MVVLNPNSRGHTQLRDFLSPTHGATPKVGTTPKCGIPLSQLEGPHRSMLVLNPNPRGQIKSVELVNKNSRGYTKCIGVTKC